MSRRRIARARNCPDLGAAIIFLLFGIAAMIGAFRYRIGSAGEMGPGYFPMALGIGLCVISLLILHQALRGPAATIEKPGLWETGWILGSIVAFALVVDVLGLFISTLLLLAGCRIASRDFRFKEVAVFGLAVAAATTGIFVYGLGVILPILPPLRF